MTEFHQNKSNNGLIFSQYQSKKKNSLNRKLRHQSYLRKENQMNRKCKQRKQQGEKSKKINSVDSTTEDFNLLNRIFLRENQRELKEKPYLAVKYQQQSTIEREKLKKMIKKYPLSRSFKSQSTTNISINTSRYHPSTIII